MITYKSPASFMKTPEGRLSALLFAGALGMTACGGGGSSSSGSAHNEGASSNISVSNCHNGDVIAGPNGSKLYCEELQAGSADVFRDIRDLFNSKEPQQLHVGQTILVKCFQDAPLDWARSAPDTTGQYSAWYMLPNGDVTAANDFWNVDDVTKAEFIKNHTPLNKQPAVAANVPSCGPPVEK